MSLPRSLLALLVLTPLSSATDFVVHPGESVQAAMEAAADGDRVLIQPGTYPETIDFQGKAIEVTGLAGPELTILDATGIGGSVVTFDDGEGRGSVLAGLTVRGGTGSVVDGWSGKAGGGVLCLDAAPTLRDCIIADNSAESSGGGLFLLGAAPEDALLERCTIRDNRATQTFLNTSGGGLMAFKADIEVVDCTFSGNSAYGSGGGVTLSQNHALLLRCTLEDNGVRHTGGGLEVEISPLTDVVVRDCVLHENLAGVPGGVPFHGTGGAMVVEVGDGTGGSLQVVNTVIRGNSANYAPGIHYWTFGTTPPTGTRLTVDHCTFSNNTFDLPFLAGTGLHVDTLLDAGEETGVDVRNSIFWGFGVNQEAITPIPIPPFLDALPDVKHCNVQNGYPGGGAGNFASDPQFVDAAHGDLHIKATSPCVGAGLATATAADADFEGDPLPAGGAPDVGADEFHAHLYLTGGAAAGEVVHVKLLGAPGPSATLLFVGAQLLDPPTVTAKGSFGVNPLFLFGFPGLNTDGLLDLPAVVPAGVPAGLQAFLQAWVGGTLTNVATLTFG